MTPGRFFFRTDFIKIGNRMGVCTRILDTTKDLHLTQAMYFNAPYSFTVVYTSCKELD